MSKDCPIAKSAVRTMNEFFEQCSKVFSFQWLIKWLGMVVLLLVSISAHCTRGRVLCWVSCHDSTIQTTFSEGQDTTG